MNLNNLEKITTKKKRRVGLGHGSGRGKTSGRGTKGQKARGDVPLDFEGGALPLIKRLPFLRGKGKNKTFRKDPYVINVGLLNTLPKNSTVDIESLAKLRLVNLEDATKNGVKILGDGELSVALTVKLPASKSAIEKITKAGGSVV
ncbi:MAG TPA: 50S ribosomal protein L15 [Candidatus Limnocylindrales bacterium]|nr:50S ribosomal protein L15 [Candidatus Limnocylindrales bacterium]